MNMKRKGLTLVEVLVVALCAAMVMGLGIALLSGSTRALNRAEERLDAREDGLMALAFVRAAVQNAWQYWIAREGRLVLFETPAGMGALRFDEERREIVLADPGADEPRRFACGRVKLVTIRAPTQGLLQVGVEVERTGTGGMATLELFRMEDSIAIPAIIGKRADVPFTVLMASPRAGQASL
jgi:type II secretory pathway pseudopilin PulG